MAGDERTDRPAVGLRTTQTPAFADLPGDDGAHELSADLPGDTAACDAGDLIEHFAEDAPRDERVPARTNEARVLLIRVPGGRDKRRSLLGDPHWPNRVSDESGGVEARTTVPATATRLLGDGLSRGVARYEALLDHVMFRRVSSAPTVRCAMPLDISAATGSLPLGAELGSTIRGTGVKGLSELGSRGRGTVFDGALQRCTDPSDPAFPQGKILGERPRNRGRSPSFGVCLRRCAR